MSISLRHLSIRSSIHRMISHDKYNLKFHDFQKSVSQSFELLRKENGLCDVTLVSEDEVHITAHKVVLSACSKFFKCLLGKFNSTNPLLYLSGVDSKNLNYILDFIYVGEVQLLHDDFDAFLGHAKKFQISGFDVEQKLQNYAKKDRVPLVVPKVENVGLEMVPNNTDAELEVAKKSAEAKAASDNSDDDSENMFGHSMLPSDVDFVRSVGSNILGNKEQTLEENPDQVAKKLLVNRQDEEADPYKLEVVTEDFEETVQQLEPDVNQLNEGSRQKNQSLQGDDVALDLDSTMHSGHEGKDAQVQISTLENNSTDLKTKRHIIQQWAMQNPNASSAQRKEVAEKFGLTEKAVKLIIHHTMQQEDKQLDGVKMLIESQENDLEIDALSENFICRTEVNVMENQNRNPFHNFNRVDFPSNSMHLTNQSNDAVVELDQVPLDSAQITRNLLLGRTKTTEDERVAIRRWAERNPTASINDRKALAAKLGLTEQTVTRLHIYYTKRNHGAVRRDEHLRGNVNTDVFYQVSKDVDVSKGSFVKNKMTKVKVKGTFNPVSSSFRVLVPLSKSKQQKQQVPNTEPPPRVQSPTSSRYNTLNLSSYFSDKPFPTEQEINHFVQCTKVPYEVTKKYVEMKQLDLPSFPQ